MSILSLRRPAAKLHPYAAPRREPRPFGLGILPPEPAPVFKETADTADSIPDDVRWIRITPGIAEGTYRLAHDPHGLREWERISDGKRTRLAGSSADRAYRDGRVAILTTEPAICPADRVAPTPKVEAAKAASRRGPSAEDRTYWSARTIGLEAEGYVPPPSHLPAELVPSWEAGMAEAGTIIGAREAEWLNDLAMQAEADAMLSAGTPWL